MPNPIFEAIARDGFYVNVEDSDLQAQVESSYYALGLRPPWRWAPWERPLYGPWIEGA